MVDHHHLPLLVSFNSLATIICWESSEGVSVQIPLVAREVSFMVVMIGVRSALHRLSKSAMLGSVSNNMEPSISPATMFTKL